MTSWAYWRPPASRGSAEADVVEYGSVSGTDVGLPLHFHDEDQVTIVLAGRRRFTIDGELIELHAGQGLAIRARTPHCSAPEPDGSHCLNIYLSAEPSHALEAAKQAAKHWMPNANGRDLRIVGDCRPSPIARLPNAGGAIVSRAAVRAGVGREWFSRAFRQEHGVSPRAFATLAKLNHARELLRCGTPLAAVAADTGFADQSHLGRCFRRAFGVSPGAYRAGG